MTFELEGQHNHQVLSSRAHFLFAQNVHPCSLPIYIFHTWHCLPSTHTNPLKLPISLVTQTETKFNSNIQYCREDLEVVTPSNHRTTALTVWTGFRGGIDRMAIKMTSQCDKTRNLALNHQTLRESISLFQLNKITFPDLNLAVAWLLHINYWAAFCRIEKTI